MVKPGVALMLSVWFGLAVAYAAPDENTGANDGAGWFGKTAGSADEAAVDDPAVAELAKLQEQMAQDGQETATLAAALKLLPKFEQAKDYAHLAECLTLIGEGYYYTGQWANTARYMQQAWDTGSKVFGDGMSTYPLKAIGDAQFEQRQYDAALKTFEQRVQILRQREDDYELPGALYDLASTHIKLGDTTTAYPLLQEASTLSQTVVQTLAADKSTDPDELEVAQVDGAEIAILLGMADIEQQQFAEARTQLELAYSALSSLPDASRKELTDRLVFTLDHLVVVCEKLGDTAKAENYRVERDALNR